jgi:hypothetical protein
MGSLLGDALMGSLLGDALMGSLLGDALMGSLLGDALMGSLLGDALMGSLLGPPALAHICAISSSLPPPPTVFSVRRSCHPRSCSSRSRLSTPMGYGPVWPSG